MAQDTDIGSRVGVVRSMNEQLIELAGYGVHEGTHLIPQWRDMAQQLLPMYRLTWQRVLDVPQAQLVAESLQLLELEDRILTEQGEPNPRTVDDQTAQDLVDRRRAELAARLDWDDETLLAHIKENERLLTSPRIRLDDGRIVWGFECFWGDETNLRTLVTAHQAKGGKVDEITDWPAVKSAQA